MHNDSGPAQAGNPDEVWMTRMREVLELGQEMKERLVAPSPYGLETSLRVFKLKSRDGIDQTGHLEGLNQWCLTPGWFLRSAPGLW